MISNSKGSNKYIYNIDEIRNISALGDVLRQIRSRLLREGISIDDARKNILLYRKKSGII